MVEQKALQQVILTAAKLVFWMVARLADELADERVEMMALRMAENLERLTESEWATPMEDMMVLQSALALVSNKRRRSYCSQASRKTVESCCLKCPTNKYRYHYSQ